MLSVAATNPVAGPSGTALTSNSSLSASERKQLRPVTALSEPARPEHEVKIIGPQPANSTRKADEDKDKEKDQDAVKDEFRLSSQAVERLIEADPALERLIRAEVARSSASGDDQPVDQAAFRAKVIEYLKSIYADDPAFSKALKMGTIVVSAVADDDDPDMQPQVTYTSYRSSALESQASSGGGKPSSVGKHDFIAWWPQ